MGGRPGSRLMRADALYDLLPDFGARKAHTEAPARSAHPFLEPAPTVAPHIVDIDAIVAERIAEARAEIEARLAAAHQAEIEAERTAHAEKTDAFLSTLGGDVGAAIATHLQSLEERVNNLVGSQAARILGALMADDLQQRSLQSLARIVRDTINDAEAVRIRVSGPLSLYETLREALGSHARNLDFIEAPGFDLTVAVDDAVFETRMSEWSQALSEVLS
jgi:hypothetical protein